MLQSASYLIALFSIYQTRGTWIPDFSGMTLGNFLYIRTFVSIRNS
jgi:hypothetical protein